MAPEHDAPEAQQPTVITPQPNAILSAPATVAACREDYENGADIRDRLDRQH